MTGEGIKFIFLKHENIVNTSGVTSNFGFPAKKNGPQSPSRAMSGSVNKAIQFNSIQLFEPSHTIHVFEKGDSSTPKQALLLNVPKSSVPTLRTLNTN